MSYQKRFDIELGAWGSLCLCVSMVAMLALAGLGLVKLFELFAGA